ncbi:MAG: SPOR domain-containing protein [bacterium]|nr:SPOR domain-containing protein [bacterium]MCP4800081.1 SPOR domain-containing protein [bacterium]
MNDDKVNEDPMEFVNQEPDEPVAEPAAEPAPKPTARPRSGTASRNQGNSKLIVGIVAVAVVIAVAVLWPRGGGDVDNNVSVMTLENQPVPAVDTPVSSDVNIEEAIAEIVPESSEATTKPEPEPEPAKVVVTPEPAITANIGAPSAEGSWGIQVFASSTMQGAENYKAKMDAKGFRAVVRSGDDGKHRVWIGYFKSRDYAEAWKRTNSGSIPDKTMVKQR